MTPPELARAVRGLADWMEATRGPGGYGGPVAHWWRDCLVDCRAGHDWRYEGAVAGCLELFELSGDPGWLARARRAGDDLVEAQTADGCFSQSRFEMNPGAGGTPHEAAAATALLRLARALRGADPSAAERYFRAAKSQIEGRLLGQLWDPVEHRVREYSRAESFVPNKACTAIEALLLFAELAGDDAVVRRHAVPTADAVLKLQVRRPGSRLDGAIAQQSAEGRVVAKYFPYYVARCIPGLLALGAAVDDERYVDAALAAGRFVARCQEPDGGFPQVLYEDGHVNRFPRWVAAVGDVLRAAEELRPHGLRLDTAASREWLLGGLLPTGAVMTARGFAQQGGPTRSELPEFRDLLPVVGWADKAFRYLARGPWTDHPVPTADGGTSSGVLEAECTFRGRPAVFGATGAEVALRCGRDVVYRWRPGLDWAQVGAPWVAVR